MSHMELCKTSYILFFLKNIFPPVTGLFLQFIISEKSLSGEYIFQLLSSRGGEESYTTDKIGLEKRKNIVVSHGKN